MTKSILPTSLVVLALLVSGCAMPSGRVAPTIPAEISIVDSGISSFPTGARSASVMFLENVGQFDPQASFQVRGENGALWLAKEGIWITLVDIAGQSRNMGMPEDKESAVEDDEGETPPETPSLRAGVQLKLSFVDANPDPQIEPFDRLSTKVSYFMGNDPAKWRTGIPAWGGVRYRDIYPGIDLEITSEEGQLVQRIVAQPEANLDAVKWMVEGADSKTLDGDALRLSTSAGEYDLPLLQLAGAENLRLSSPSLSGDQLSSPFSLSTTPRLRSSTVSSPGLVYSTFLGGGTNATGLAIDSSGAAYISGYAYSTIYPITPGAFDASLEGYCDVFVAKLSSDGSTLLYSTLLGGSDVETGYAITVDSSGAAYVTGSTYSLDFPTTPGAFDRIHGDGVDLTNFDVFVTKLDPEGSSLVYSTYLGGWDEDEASEIIVDGSGAVYLTGYTRGGKFPTTPGAYDTTYNKENDVFVTKLNPQGSALIYSTYIGGGGSDSGADIALDNSGAIYITGSTRGGFPTTPGAFDTTFNACTDAFVAKLNSSGSTLVYSTYLGGRGDGNCSAYGTGFDGGSGIAIDSNGNVYIAGSSDANNFPTTLDSYDPGYNGSLDVIVAKFDPTLSELIYSTFIGSTGWEGASSIAIDSSGAAYITGQVLSSNFPTTPGAFDTVKNPDDDAFVAKLDPTGSILVYSSYLGGNSRENGRNITLDSSRAAYISGPTGSADFPTTEGAYDTVYSGGETFVIKMYMASANTDAYIQFPNEVIGSPGGVVEIPIGYGNGGMADAVSPALTVTLPVDLSYLSDTSGIIPAVDGETYTWSFPDIPFPNHDQFILRLALSPAAVPGASYSLSLEIASSGTEDNPGDNSAFAKVSVANSIFLPVIKR